MDPGLLYQSPLLSQLAQRYDNRDFVAEQALPLVDVDFEQFQFHTWDRGPTFRRQNTKYGHDGQVGIVDIKATKNTGNTEARGLGAYIDEKEERQAPGIAVQSLKTETLLDAILLDMEMQVASTLTDTAQITQNATLAGTSQWSDYVNSDPKNEVLTRMQSILGTNITMIVGRQVHDKLRLHPKITDAVKYTRGAIETQDILAAYFGVKKYLVGDGFVDSSTEGQAESLGFIWGKHCVMLHTPPQPNALMNKASAGYIARWKGGAAGPRRVYTAKVPTRGTGQGSTFVKVETDYKVLFTSQLHMFLLKNVVA